MNGGDACVEDVANYKYGYTYLSEEEREKTSKYDSKRCS